MRAIDADKLLTELMDRGLDHLQRNDWEEVIQIVQDAPTIQFQRMRGKWLSGTCSRCGGHAPFWAMATTYYNSNFCPHCGADMWDNMEIAKDILHRAIDNTKWAEGAYPNIKERLHKAVDEYEEKGE